MSAQVNITPEIGTNIPKDHLAEHKPIRTPPDGKALDQLKTILTSIDKELDESARVRVGAWVRNFMMVLYGGVRSTWGIYNVQQGMWDTMDQQDLGRLYNVNYMLTDFTTVKGTLERSRVKLKVTPAAAKATDIKAKMSAEVAQRKVDHDYRTEIDANFLSCEFTYLLCTGTCARYRGFDKTKGPMEQSALLEPNQVESPGTYFCQNPKCGSSGSIEELKDDMCPGCEGPAVQSPGDTLESEAHTGYDESPSGQTCTYSVNPFELGMPNEATGPDKSPFLRWEQRTRHAYIAHKYKVKPGILKGNEGLSPSLTALQVIQNYGQPIQQTDPQFGVFKRYWLEPFMYSQVEINGELELASGVVIPEGKLTKYAPNGLYIAKMGDVFLDIQPGCAADCWSGSQYHHRPMSPYGVGIDDSADIQEWESEVLSIKIEHAQRDSVGITFFKRTVGIDQSKMVGGANVGVDLPDPEADINKSVMQLNPNPASNSINETLAVGRDAMKGTMGAYDVMSGSNENVPDTATGLSLAQEKAVGIQGQFLARWAASWCVWAVQGLRWSRRYQSEAQFVPYTDPGDSEAGKWFKASDLDTDYTITAEEDSWIPRTRLDAIADYERMVTLLGAIAPLALSPDQLPDVSAIFSHFATLLNAPSDINATQKDQQVARAIIDQVKAAVEYYESMPEPPAESEWPDLLKKMLTMPSIQALPAIGSAQIFIKSVQDSLKDVIDDDDVENQPSPMLVQALMGLIQAGKAAQMQAAQEQGQMAQALNPQPPPEDKPDPLELERAKAETVMAKTQATEQAESERQDKDLNAEAHRGKMELLDAHAERDFKAEELDKTQLFEASQAALERKFQAEQSERQRQHDAQEAEAARKVEGERAEKDRAHALKLLKAKPLPAAPGAKK